VVVPDPSQYDQDMAARQAREDRHKGINVDNEPRDQMSLRSQLDEKILGETELKRRIEDLSSRFETCLKQRDKLMKLCKEQKIPTGINLDLNDPYDEDEDDGGAACSPQPPPYQSSDEESEQEPQKMPAKKLNAMLQKVRKGHPKTEMEIIV
jgi:hypothetical protein